MKVFQSVDKIFEQYEDGLLPQAEVPGLILDLIDSNNVDSIISRLTPGWRDFFLSWARHNFAEGAEPIVLGNHTPRAPGSLEALRGWLASNPPSERELQYEAREIAQFHAIQVVWETRPRQAFLELLRRAKLLSGPPHERYSVAFASMSEDERRQLDLFFDRVAAVDPSNDLLVKIRGGGVR